MIPKHINNLSIADYCQFKTIQQSTVDFSIDKNIKYLEYFTNKHTNYFEALSENELTVWLKKLKPIVNSRETGRIKKSFWIGFKRFKLAKDDKDFNVNAWTALNTFEEDTLKNLHKIIAIYYQRTPIFKKWKFNDATVLENAKLFKDKLKVKDFIGGFFFYQNHFENQKVILKVYEKINQLELDQHMVEVRKHLKDLGVNMDGSLSFITSQVEAMLKERKF